MDDNILSREQIQKIISRMKLNVGGYRDDKKTSVVYGSASYTQPITNRINATISASGYKVDGEWGDVEGIGYKGINLEYKF